MGGKESTTSSDKELKAPSLLPDCGPPLPVPATNSLMVSENFRCCCTPGRIHQMLIMCLFSLSAILASVLITIYILQHLHWEKEPTLIVPDWQSRAIKHGTICSEQSNIWGSETTQRRGSACSVRAGEENGGTGVSLLFNKKFSPFPLVSVPHLSGNLPLLSVSA